MIRRWFKKTKHPRNESTSSKHKIESKVSPGASMPEQAPEQYSKPAVNDRPQQMFRGRRKSLSNAANHEIDNEPAPPRPPKSPKSPSKPKDRSKTTENDYETSNFKLRKLTFDSVASFEKLGREKLVHGSIQKGIKKFKANPEKYLAIKYQTSLMNYPTDDQKYTLIFREGTVDYKPMNISPQGWMTILLQEYEAMPTFDSDELPRAFRDRYTDTVLAKHRGQTLPRPLMPGRGMGVCDAPNIKIIGDVDPSDIHQGAVGDCWLLSGISSLAEFDGAVKKLFRKTKSLEQRPMDKPNQYIVTLWDLETWKEVDIVIDERLCASPLMPNQLLASKPSVDGELWVCYLEKALAAHCGGWDKITGGQCTHAWALMTGCKYQYTIQYNRDSKTYGCYGRKNPKTGEWMKHTNSPHDSDPCVYPMEWPEVGGGGKGEFDKENVFKRLCEWDKVNYIMSASRGSFQKKEEGMVDNHAYSVIECLSNVAGTKIDLIKVRNPWGKGEIENGEFDDDGPGWDIYPEIKNLLKPVVADDGIFWVTKKEFFDLFDTIYVSASNMTEFIED